MLGPVARTKLIVNLTQSGALCVCELADRPLLRLRGLLGRSELPAGEGLFISPAPSIHTAFMRFPIDALFLDREMRVVRIVERLRPWRMASKRGARAVLELAAGECARRGVQVGDRLELRDRTPADAAPAGAADYADLDASNGADLDAVEPGTPDGQWQAGELARLRPLRVVVVSPDRQFRTVMSLLLARRNCSVSTTASRSRVTELIARESADVVVIDGSQLLGGSTVEAPTRPVGVVLVADDGCCSLPDTPVLAKWGPFGELVAAIEHADERRGTVGNLGSRP